VATRAGALSLRLKDLLGPVTRVKKKKKKKKRVWEPERELELGGALGELVERDACHARQS